MATSQFDLLLKAARNAWKRSWLLPCGCVIGPTTTGLRVEPCSERHDEILMDELRKLDDGSMELRETFSDAD